MPGRRTCPTRRPPPSRPTPWAAPARRGCDRGDRALGPDQRGRLAVSHGHRRRDLADRRCAPGTSRWRPAPPRPPPRPRPPGRARAAPARAGARAPTAAHPGRRAHPVGHSPRPAGGVPAGHPRDRWRWHWIRRLGPRVGHLRGVVSDGRELAGQQLESPRDGGVVVGGEGSATHVDDARSTVRPVRPRRDRRLWRRESTDGVGEGERAGQVSRGATQAATMPGPTCAPSTAPSSPHQTSRPSRLAARRSPSRAVRSAARSGLARWETQTSTSQVPGRLDDQILQPAQRPRRGAHPLEVRHPTVLDPQERLHGEGTAEQRGGRPDPAAPPEVLQGVDVEQRGRPLGPPPRRGGRLVDRPAGVEDVGRAQRGVPGGDADLPRVDHGDGQRRVAGGEQGGLVGAAHVARQVDRQHGVGAVRGGLLVHLEQGRGRRPRRAHRTEVLQRLRHQLGRGPVRALVVDGRADHHLQGHDDDAALVRHLGRQRGRRVGDDHGPARHARKASRRRC